MKRHWSTNGMRVPDFNGIPYYFAGHRNNKKFRELNKHTDLENPFFTTNEAIEFPIIIDGISEFPVFLGYFLKDNYPQFHYKLGKYEIKETIISNEHIKGIERHFTVFPQTKLKFRIAKSKTSKTLFHDKKMSHENFVEVDFESSKNFVLTHIEIE